MRIAWLTFYLLAFKKHHNVNRGFIFAGYSNIIPVGESSNLDLVPKQQTLEEARLIIEGLQSLRSKKMHMLLKACKKIKVKRLFWKVAEDLQLPVLKKVDKSEIDFGSKSDYTLQGEKTWC